LLHLPQRQISAHAGLEAFGRQSLAGDQLAITLDVQRAVCAAQDAMVGFCCNSRASRAIAGHQMHLVGRLGQHTLAHQALQRGITGLWRIEQLDVERGGGGLDALHLGLVGKIPLPLGDVAAAYAGHGGARVIEPLVAVDAHQDERRDDQQEHHEHQNLGVLADIVEHARTLHEKNKKANMCVRLCGGWWVLTGSNRRPTPCKGAALPTELSTPPKPTCVSVQGIFQCLAWTELWNLG
jgi:hypothetical protein